jgi:hypothetical protein
VILTIIKQNEYFAKIPNQSSEESEILDNQGFRFFAMRRMIKKELPLAIPEKV